MDREPRARGAAYEPLVEAFETARNSRATEAPTGGRAARSGGASASSNQEHVPRKTRRRASSPTSSSDEDATPRYADGDARGSAASKPALIQDKRRASPRGADGRDTTTMGSPAVTPPAAPTANDNTLATSGSGAMKAPPGSSVPHLRLDGEPKRSMRVQGNKVELWDDMPPLSITQRVQVRGTRKTRKGRADTPELDQSDAPETDAAVGPVMLPGVAHSRLPNTKRAFKLPAQWLKSVEKDQNHVHWPEIEYELDEDDEAWLNANPSLGLNEDKLEFLIDRLEKSKARCPVDVEVSWEEIAALVCDDFSTVTIAATVGWWQEKRKRQRAPLLRRLRPQTDFHDHNQDNCFRPQIAAPMSVRERTSSVNYRVIATGSNQPLTQPASDGPPSLSPRQRRAPTITARVQRLATSKIQIRPGCCITPPFLELTQPGPAGRDDASSVQDRVREMHAAKIRKLEKDRAAEKARRERRDRAPTERGRLQIEQKVNSNKLDLVIGATVRVKAVEFGEAHAQDCFGDGWASATYTGTVVNLVMNARFDGTDPRFEDGADVCMVRFEDGVFPVPPAKCRVLISPLQRPDGSSPQPSQDPHTQQRISTGWSPGNVSYVKRQKVAIDPAKDVFKTGDMVYCPSCSQRMKAPQAAFALRCAGCSFAITPASVREIQLKESSSEDEAEVLDDTDECPAHVKVVPRRPAAGAGASSTRETTLMRQLQIIRAKQAEVPWTGGVRLIKARKIYSKRWKVYKSLTSAAEATEVDRSDVSKCARGRLCHLKGWMFEYLQDGEDEDANSLPVPAELQAAMKEASKKMRLPTYEEAVAAAAAAKKQKVTPAPQTAIVKRKAPEDELACGRCERNFDTVRGLLNHKRACGGGGGGGGDPEEETESNASNEEASTEEKEEDESSDEESDESESESITCMACGLTDHDEKLILCDGCDNARHTFCCVPVIKKVPKGVFYCGECNKGAGPNPASRPVFGRKIGDERWNRYASVTAAGRATGGIDTSNVSKCCRGKMASCKGHEFKYCRELEPEDDDA